MAATEFAKGSAQDVVRWSTKTFRETMDKTYLKRFLGKSEDSCIQMLPDLESQPGSTIKYDVRYQNRGDGVQGDTTLEGYEAALEYQQDSLDIDQLRHAHAFRKMTQQRSVHDLRKDGRDSLTTWAAWKLDTMMFAYLAGAVGDGAETASGTIGSSGFAGNALAPADAAHLHDKTGSTLTLQMLTAAKTLALINNPRLRPIMVDGKPKFIVVLHPYSVYALRIDTGADSWNEIQIRAQQRGPSNPIYTGALGEYNGMVLHESEYIPTNDGATVLTGFSAQNDKLNLLLGAQAGVFALGNAYDTIDRPSYSGGTYFKYTEQEDDYKNKKGVSVAACFGMKKVEFPTTGGGADANFGAMTIRTTDAAPT